MSNFISVTMLKHQNPSLPNRGEDGYAKTCIVGGTMRARISSQCIKRAMRTTTNSKQIRSGHFEDLVELLLLSKVDEGIISNDDTNTIAITFTQKDTTGKKKKCTKTVTVFDALGEEISNLIGADWKKRASIDKTDNASENTDNGKGRTMEVIDPDEVAAIVDTVINDYIEKGKEKHFTADNAKNLRQVATLAYQQCGMSADKAFYGVMATDSVIETIYGAARFSHAYSVDEYAGDMDDWTASFDAGIYTDSDPYYGELNKFTNNRNKSLGATGMGSMSIYSNLMYSYMDVNIDQFYEHLSSGNESVRKTAKGRTTDETINRIMAFATSSPFAKQTSCVSLVPPTMLYIEVIESGQPITVCFDKAIKNTEHSNITEQAIRKINNHYADDTFRVGNIKRYVLLCREYKYLSNEFEENGVIVLNNLNDLRQVLTADIDKMIAI